jgi:hypothetical protein
VTAARRWRTSGPPPGPGTAQATADLLHALARCLAADPTEANRALYPACAPLEPAQCGWLRAHLLPQVLLVRPTPPLAEASEGVCAALDRRAPTALELALQQPEVGCSDPARAAALAPERPACP